MDSYQHSMFTDPDNILEYADLTDDEQYVLTYLMAKGGRGTPVKKLHVAVKQLKERGLVRDSLQPKDMWGHEQFETTDMGNAVFERQMERLKHNGQMWSCRR